MDAPPRAAVETFAALGRVLFPGRDGVPSADELAIGDRLPEALAGLASDGQRRQAVNLLLALSTAAGGLALHGYPRAFGDLDRPAAEDALRRLATARVPQKRTAARALRALVGRLLAAPLPATTGSPSASGARSPLWDAMGYPGPDGVAPPTAKRLAPIAITAPTTWEADVVVVGSGAGGGVAAAVLAQAGLDVVVLERGLYRNEADFTHVEAKAYRDLYLDGAAAATDDLGVALLAGACLGGGTVVNYTTSLPLPDRVRAEWDRAAGASGWFTGAEFEASTQAVVERLGCNTDHSWASPRDELLEKGVRDLGWRIGSQPRNARGCTTAACGWCSLGCRLGAKQSSLRTWLEDAADVGARIVVGADVERALVERGRAAGVVATVDDQPLEVRARAVVFAAGALSTPALLERSGIDGPALGRLWLHPVTAVWGRFDAEVDQHTGIQQARYCDQFADLDGQGHGFLFETAAVHPTLVAALLPFRTGAELVDDLAAWRHWSHVGVLLRDRDPGRVTLGRDGRPRWRYRLSSRDTVHLREAVRRGAQVLAAAGAVQVVAPLPVRLAWRPEHEPLHRYMERADVLGWGAGRTPLVSFHQMGTAAIGADVQRGVVAPDAQVHGTPGLYVMDASCFPTPSGVNPMVTISALAHRAATDLAAVLS